MSNTRTLCCSLICMFYAFRNKILDSLTIVTIFFRPMYIKKKIIKVGFCDIQNNQDLGKGYQPTLKASADNSYLDLNYSRYRKNLIQ